MSHGANRAAGRDLGQEPYSKAYKVSSPTLGQKVVRRGSYGQYVDAAGFVLGTLPTCQQIIRPRELANVPVQLRCDATGGEAPKTRGEWAVAALPLDWRRKR